MKTLITFFFLLFSSMVVAGNISDFEIGGMSLGDSLLDYLSKEEILKEFEIGEDEYSWTDQIFTDVYIYEGKGDYEYFSTSVKRKDKKFIIYSIRGMIDYNDINKCLKKQKEVSKELSLIFKKKKTEDIYSHSADNTKKSKVYDISFIINAGEVRVICYDFAEHMPDKNGLDVEISSEEYMNWLKKFHRN